jgi:3-phenylpropionate/cinnamic acid dioxygenase small subunit
VSATRDLYRECTDFLVREAEYLDDNRMREWLELLHRNVVYRMPIRVTRERAAGPGFSETSWHLNETWGSLETRVARLESEYAWAEDPPSRTRRFVTNFRIEPRDGEDEANVRSNILLYRGRYDSPAFQFLSAERHDVLRLVDSDWKLLERLVLLDHTTLGTQNLAVFL